VKHIVKLVNEQVRLINAAGMLKHLFRIRFITGKHLLLYIRSNTPPLLLLHPLGQLDYRLLAVVPVAAVMGLPPLPVAADIASLASSCPPSEPEESESKLSWGGRRVCGWW
jgi:hypothetical protein